MPDVVFSMIRAPAPSGLRSEPLCNRKSHVQRNMIKRTFSGRSFLSSSLLPYLLRGSSPNVHRSQVFASAKGGSGKAKVLNDTSGR